MSPGDFLKDASASDHSLDQDRPGMASQRIRIQGSGRVVDSTLYRDLQGRRQPRIPAPTPEVGLLHSALTVAGVDWDEPLSATSFANWHDHAPIRDDVVSRTGKNMLTLTTTVADPKVAAESLTVRQSDFHPIARTVHLRDMGTIEIAELDYSVSGWNAANDAAFSPAVPPLPSRPAAIVVPSLPTPEELDQAELQARLVVSQDAVVSSEALGFTRTGSNIRIHGAVGTNERKQELLARLRAVPHVTASIFSIEELSASHATDEPNTPSKGGQPTATGPSPLTTLFLQQSRSPKEAASVSRQVLVAMFAVQQESAAIGDLVGRFTPATHLTSTAQDALARLLAEHRQRLDDALTDEEQLVRSLLGVNNPSPDARPAAQAGLPTLYEASARNRILCNELVSSSEASSRTAGIIARDVLVSIEDIRQSLISAGSPVVHEISEQK